MPTVEETSNHSEIIAAIIGALSGGLVSLIVNAFTSNQEDKRILKSILYELSGFYRNVIILYMGHRIYINIINEMRKVPRSNIFPKQPKLHEINPFTNKIEFLNEMLSPIDLFQEFDEIVKNLSRIRPKLALKFTKERHNIVSLKEQKEIMLNILNIEKDGFYSLDSDNQVKFSRAIEKLNKIIPILENFMYDVAGEISILEYHYITDEIRMTEENINNEYNIWDNNLVLSKLP